MPFAWMPNHTRKKRLQTSKPPKWQQISTISLSHWGNSFPKFTKSSSVFPTKLQISYYPGLTWIFGFCEPRSALARSGKFFRSKMNGSSSSGAGLGRTPSDRYCGHLLLCRCGGALLLLSWFCSWRSSRFCLASTERPWPPAWRNKQYLAIKINWYKLKS